jgi:hypothetical protein
MKGRMLAAARAAGVGFLGLGVWGCGWILGLDEYSLAEPDAGAGGSDAGSDGAGSGGSGGGVLCEPGSVASCYSGAPGTLGVGVCASGEQECNGSGLGFGDCVGEVLPGFEVCSTAADEDCDGNGACTGSHLWSFRFGDAASQKAYGLAADKDGNVIVAGTFEGAIDFGGGELKSAGATDVFVAKLGPSGEHIWSARFGDAEAQYSVNLAVDAEGSLILAGAFQGSIDFGGGALTSAAGTSNAFVVKLDAAGKHAWSRLLADAGSPSLKTLGANSAGDILVAGTFSGTVDFGGGMLSSSFGSSDLFVVKLNAMGSTSWSKRFGNMNTEDVTAVAVSNDGSGFLAGKFEGTLDFGSGSMTSMGAGTNIFVVRLGSDGVCLWSKRFGDQAKQNVWSLAVDPEDNVVMTGSFFGTIDFGGDVKTNTLGADVFIAKLNSGGGHLFSNSFGDEAIQHSKALAVSTVGEIIVTGSFGGTIDFGGGPLTAESASEAFLAKFSATGDHLWSKRFGEIFLDHVFIDGSDSTLVTGWLQGTTELGGGSLVSAGSDDVVVAKLEP